MHCATSLPPRFLLKAGPSVHFLEIFESFQNIRPESSSSSNTTGNRFKVMLLRAGRLKLSNLSRDCLLGREPFYTGCAKETCNRVCSTEHKLYVVRLCNRATMAEHDHIRTDRFRGI